MFVSLPLPAQGTVEIWCADLDALAVGPEAAAILHPDEAERAARYYFERDRNRYQCARLLRRLLLGKYLGANPAAVRLRYGHHGKPGVEQGGPLRFNLSHSHGEALFAFTNGAEVGVDVEQVRDIAEVNGIIASHFTAGERQSICDTGEQGVMAAFHRCWTRKEAYVKGLGEGLSFPLQAVSLENGHCGSWTIQSFDVRPGYAAAVAVELPGVTLTIRASTRSTIFPADYTPNSFEALSCRIIRATSSASVSVHSRSSTNSAITSAMLRRAINRWA